MKNLQFNQEDLHLWITTIKVLLMWLKLLMRAWTNNKAKLFTVSKLNLNPNLSCVVWSTMKCMSGETIRMVNLELEHLLLRGMMTHQALFQAINLVYPKFVALTPLYPKSTVEWITLLCWVLQDTFMQWAAMHMDSLDLEIRFPKIYLV